MTCVWLFTTRTQAWLPLNCISCSAFCLQVTATQKLPLLYLIDSMIKNLTSTLYPQLFIQNIISIFCRVFEEVLPSKWSPTFNVSSRVLICTRSARFKLYLLYEEDIFLFLLRCVTIWFEGIFINFKPFWHYLFPFLACPN